MRSLHNAHVNAVAMDFQFAWNATDGVSHCRKVAIDIIKMSVNLSLFYECNVMKEHHFHLVSVPGRARLNSIFVFR